MTRLPSRVAAFDTKQHTSKELIFDTFKLADYPNDIFWIHCNLHEPKDLLFLKEQLQLPQELIDIAESREKLPKLVDNGETLIIRFQGVISWDPHLFNAPKIGTLTIYLTDRYCLTLASDPIMTLVGFEQTYSKSLKYAETPCFILFLIFEEFINIHNQILFNFEIMVEKIDAHLVAALHNPYTRVMHAKKILMRLKRNISAARDILMKISGRKIQVISDRCRHSLTGLFSHSQMIFIETDEIRDYLSSTLDQIDNTLMQQMSQSMKILAAFAAIFLPLTLIAGIYGMNFDNMPELHWHYGYYWALGLMLGFGLLFSLYFKIKRWL